MSEIPEHEKIDLDKIIQEFVVQCVDEEAANLSTDPNVKRMKIERVKNEFD